MTLTRDCVAGITFHSAIVNLRWQNCMDTLRKPNAPVKVDCHVHLFPTKLFRAIRRWFEAAGWEIGYPYETEEVLDLLSSFGVEEAWALTYAHRPGVAEGINAWLATLKRQVASREGASSRRWPTLRGFFSVHPGDDDPTRIARRALDEHGLDGLKLHAEVQNLCVDDTRLDGVFDLLEERGCPCLLHSGDAPYPEPKPNLDVARVAARMHRNPHLVAVIAHLGANQTEDYLKLTERYPNLYLEVSFTNIPVIEHPIDTNVLEPYTSRLLFGSDFPNITFSYADQADAWYALDWIKRDADAFFGGRAMAIFRDT